MAIYMGGIYAADALGAFEQFKQQMTSFAHQHQRLLLVMLASKATESWCTEVDRDASEQCTANFLNIEAVHTQRCRCSSSGPVILVGLQAEDVAGKCVGLVGCDDKIRHVLVAGFQKHL
jgi:hypothetical protein